MANLGVTRTVFVLAGVAAALLFVAAAQLSYSDVRGAPYTVALNPRGLAINGTPTLLLSGDVHYARAEPDMQERVLAMLKADGLNTVQTYAFWSVHESKPDAFDFGSPRANVSAFLQRAADAGLFVSMRIGPFICGEWSYGGIPAWINQILDAGKGNIRAIGPWEGRMSSFVKRFFAEIEPFLAKNGGPIVLLQLENEDGPAEPTIPYVQYVYKLAESLGASLPYLWCGVSCDKKGCDPMRQLPLMVPAFNGNDGATWAEQTEAGAPRYPLMWTENEGWYHPWGSDPIDDGGVGLKSSADLMHATGRPSPSPTQHCDRDPKEVAFAVARWVARGGAFMNYYMFFGGQHHGASAAAGNLNHYAGEDAAVAAPVATLRMLVLTFLLVLQTA